MIVGTLLAGWLSASVPAGRAQEKAPEKRWKDQAEVAAISTSGNTDVLTLSFRNALSYDFSSKLTGTWDLSALYGEQDNVKNAERYSTDLRGDYKLGDANYGYLSSGWLRDEFAGFRNRYYLGPGIGQRFLEGKKALLAAEIGLNLTREEYETGSASDFLEGRLFGKYEYRFSEGNQFLQTLEYLQDFKDTSNYKLLSRTTLTSALTKIIALRLGYEIRYQNRPIPASLEKTDTVFSGSLVLNF